jgi:hypothetical protein
MEWSKCQMIVTARGVGITLMDGIKAETQEVGAITEEIQVGGDTMADGDTTTDGGTLANGLITADGVRKNRIKVYVKPSKHRRRFLLLQFFQRKHIITLLQA